jgi:murein DD-endopeptidase MepM/ murein hydrolase activator NlpD
MTGAVDVLARFDVSAGPYGPGHRGVDLAAPAGTTILAAAGGIVTFAGPVAGRGVVVVAHGDGITTEYEPLQIVVRLGDAVAAGSPLGTVQGGHQRCQPATCLHWGAKQRGEYIDPLSLLRRLGVVRLVPWQTPAS